MKIRVKLFLLILSILVPLMVILSIVLPIGIKHQMMIDVENKLLDYRKISTIFINQTRVNKDIGYDLSNQMDYFEDELSNMFDINVSVYYISDTLANSYDNDMNMSPEVQAALDGNIAYRESPNNVYFAFPIQDTLIVTMQYPLDMINQTLDYIKVTIYASTILMVCFAIIGGLLVSKTFTDPIVKLNKAVKKIKQGDYSVALKSNSRDEVGELASSLKDMSQEIERRISQLKHMLEEEKRLKNLQRDFINNVTHEFKTPLTSIIGYTDLLEQYKDDKGLLDDAVKAIKSDSNRLNEMVERLLYLSSVERYDIVLKLDNIDVNQLIKQSIEAVKIKAMKKEIQVSKAINYTGKIYGDYEMLFRMMVNLLDNGIKYNYSGGRIDVKASEFKNCLSIVVKDTGIGIDKEDIENVFQPFFRADKNRSKKVKGYGLGLSIVKEVIDRHNGEIDIISQKDLGTEVKIQLPLK